MQINFGRELSNQLNVGDKFYVHNGAWYGVVKNKDSSGITIDAQDEKGNSIREIHYNNDTFVDIDIDNFLDGRLSIIQKDNDTTEKKIIFDIDDILWSLNKRIANILGIDYDKLHTFSIFENQLLTGPEKDAILKAYSDKNIFENIDWHPGAEKIMDLEKYDDVKVYINSNCNTPKIAELKYKQIHKLIDIPDSQLILNVLNIDLEEHKKKEIGDNVYAFIDDSPHNLMAAKADNLYTLNKPWNMNVPELKNLNIKRFNTLEEIIDDLSKGLSIEQEHKEELYDDIELN